MSTFLKPGYVRWDGSKYVTDPEIEILGPQGSPGPRGLQGARGPQGSNTGFTGPRGHQGLLGPTGPRGPAGFSGSAGTQGSIGLTGPVGAQGQRGFQGYTGSTGQKGSQGHPGITGPQGYTGSIGFQGYTGSIGLTGPQGYTGSIGFQGYTGSIGSQGYTGSIGLSGQQGYTGSTGPQGPTGSNELSFSAELEPGLSVLDLVCVSSTASSQIKVGKASADDETKMPIIGILVNKNTETQGTVVVSSVISMSGLVPGAIYFAGLSGSITNIPPTPISSSVFIQQIGIALTQNLLLLNLSTNYMERVYEE